MNRPSYEAIDGQGLPYIRPARIVDELASPEARLAALESATQSLANLLNCNAQRRVQFGTPVFVAFGLTQALAKNHAHAKVLLTAGHSLSLGYCPEYN